MKIYFLNFNNIKIILFLFLLKSISSRCGDWFGWCLDSFTLSNDNIIITTDQNISFYDSSLSLLNHYYNNLEYQEDFKYIHINQHSNEFGNYILLLSNNLLLFDEEGTLLCNKSLELNIFTYKYIVPISKIEDYLYFIITFIKKGSFNDMICILYYKIKMDSCKIDLITSKNNTIKQIPYSNCECLLMNDISKNNILTCFYSSYDNSYENIYISATTFSVNNDIITKLNDYSNNNPVDSVEYLKVKSVGNDKSNAIISVMIRNDKGYVLVFDINSKKFILFKELIQEMGYYVPDSLNVEYFERTNEILLYYDQNNNGFIIFGMNLNYDIIFNRTKYDIFGDDTENTVFRSIAYLEGKKQYIIFSEQN